MVHEIVIRSVFDHEVELSRENDGSIKVTTDEELMKVTNQDSKHWLDKGLIVSKVDVERNAIYLKELYHKVMDFKGTVELEEGVQ